MVKDNEGWKSSEAARHHLRTADVLSPGRRESLSLIARLATDYSPDEPSIMDLGCGYGDLTGEILSLKPLASVCMVDFSDEMLQLAGERFGDNKRIEIVKHDLNKGIPASLKSKRFDSIVSSYMLHHVEFENKVPLYTQVKQVLNEDGFFIIGDRFTGDSPVMRRWEFDSWISWMSGQIKEKLGKDIPFDELTRRQNESDNKLGDKPGTIWDTRRDLEQAGFRYVDCIWKSHNMAIVAAADR
jgi:tRNA (cmo5U34)-methyltransferase